MTPYGFVTKYPEPEHHWMIVVTAILLSIVIHLGMMFYFRDWSFSSPSGIKERMMHLFNADRVQPMRVERLPEDPLFAMAKMAGQTEPPQREVMEVSKRVDQLSQSSPPALTAPPPIPREALTPGVPQLSESTIKPVDSTPWLPRQEIAQIFDRTVQDDVAMLPRREIPLIERVSHAQDIVPSIDLAGRQFGNEPLPPTPIAKPEVLDTAPMKGTSLTPAVPPPAVPPQLSASATEKRFAADAKEQRGKVEGKLTDEERAKIQKEIEAESKKVAAQTSASQGADGVKPVQQNQESPAERAAREAQQKISDIQETVAYEPIDDLLSVGLETYRDKGEPDKVYFRIGIQPRTDKPVPVIPKDIVFVQDVSGSMGEERIMYCRRAIEEALTTLNTGDRFNVVAFRDTFENCFPTWAQATADNIAKADTFVRNMRSFGQTDVFGSLKSLINFQRNPNRPMIAYVITDGKPTFGEVKSAAIIGDFSKLNNGMMSIYMFGASTKANAYLIDMLTYCNRGNSALLNGNRWDIPKAMEESCQGIRNPVMGDVTVTFDVSSKAEVYPRSTTNLYKDRQLDLCGVCPAGTDEIVCQVRGLASDKGYDSIIRLSLSKDARFGKSTIKMRWARQKMYHLVGEYSRQPRQDTMEAMVALHRKYGVLIPYETELK